MPINTNTKIEFPYRGDVYRGDDRLPETIFRKGFKSYGNNKNIFDHLDGGVNSAYIATSKSKEIAKRFPTTAWYEKKPIYVYDINLRSGGVDIQPYLLSEINTGKITAEDYLRYKNEIEVSALKKIKPEDIRGAWEVEFLQKSVPGDWDEFVEKINEDSKYQNKGEFAPRMKENFIENPHYKPLGTEGNEGYKFWKNGRVLGHTLTGTAIFLDGMDLHEAYQQGAQSGNYDIFFKESTKVIGGWSGALSLGTALAGAGTISCGPICGIIGGVVGSVFGYRGGSTVAEIYNDLPHLKTPEPSVQITTINPSKCISTLFSNKENRQKTTLTQISEKIPYEYSEQNTF